MPETVWDAVAASGPYVVVYKDTVVDPVATTNQLQAQYGFNARFDYSSALKGFGSPYVTGPPGSICCSGAGDGHCAIVAGGLRGFHGAALENVPIPREANML